MRRSGVKVGTAWLVSLSCLCILGSAAVAVAGGGVRTVPVTLQAVEKVSPLDMTLMYLDQAGQETRATKLADGSWQVQIGDTQRKLTLWAEGPEVASAASEVLIPAEPNVALRAYLEEKGLRAEIIFLGPDGAAAAKATSTNLTALDRGQVGALRQGGDTCAAATVIAGLPFSATGSTTGFANDYDEVCPFTGSIAPDVAYSFTPGANVTIDITLCNGSAYDTKLYVYESSCPGTVVACNDDECPGFVSELLGVSLTGGLTYYVIVDGYSSSSGSYVLDITEATAPPPPPACPVDTLFGQVTHLPADAWSAGTSEINVNGSNLLRAESFSGLTNAICDIHWWGLSLFNDGFAWSVCTDSNPQFEIKFYQDAAGAPGAEVATYTVIPTITPTGLFYAGFELNSYSVDTLTPCVVLPAGWVSIQGLGDTTCWFLWMSSGTGDGSSHFNNNGVPEPYLFDNSLCLTGPNVPILGACCDDATGICNDGVDMTACTGRFEADTLCANLDPPCGNPGACCNDDTAVCDDGVLQANCLGRFAPGTLCAVLDPVCGAGAPLGACCNPADDSCTPDKTQSDCDLAFGPGNWIEGVGCVPNPCITGCDHSIVLTDDFGDGWNGGSVEVFVNAGSVGVFTLASGFGPETHLFQADTGDSITTVYTAGSWSWENEYVIYDVNGTLLCADGTGGSTPAGCSTTGFCGPDPCAGNQPPNDDCLTATPVAGPYPVTMAGDNTCAAIDCPGVLDWEATWFAVDLPFAVNNLYVDYCGTAQEIFTVGIVIYNTCGNCAGFDIADSFAFPTCPDLLTNPQMEWLELPGPATVYFPAYTALEDGSPMAYSVTFDVQEVLPPPNDFCENAIAVAVPSVTAGWTGGGTTDTGFPSPCGTSITSPGVWYSVTGTGNTMTADLCNGATGYDAKLSVYCTDCVEPMCVDGNDDSCGLQSSVTWCSQSGANYLILVHGFGGATGPFELTVSDDGLSCSGAVKCLPEGACCLDDTSCIVTTEGDCAAQGGGYQGDDTDCGGLFAAAEEKLFPCNQTVNGTLDGASPVWNRIFGGSVDLTCNSAVIDSGLNGQFYAVFAITTTVSENLEAEIVGAGTTIGDTTMTLYCDPFDPLNPMVNVISYDDDGGAGLLSAFFAADGIFLNAGVTYNLVISTFSGGATGNFELCLGGNFVVGGGGPGACCLPDGSCADGMEAGACSTAGGTFGGGGSDCVTFECPALVGACCMDGTCTITTDTCCANGGGTFLGGNTGCGGVAVEVLFENFNAGIPAGWTVTDNIAGGGPFVWVTNAVSGRTNYAGGDGLCPVSDSDAFNIGGADYDTSLISPAFVVPGGGTLDFVAAYNFLSGEQAEVNITVDGGATWTNLLTWTEDHDAFGPGEAVSLDISANAGQTAQIAFRHVGSGWDWYYEVDDVSVNGMTQGDNPCPLCFGLNEVKLKKSECGCDDEGDDCDEDDHYEVKLKGSLIPSTPIDLTVDDVTYTIEDGFGYVFDLTIPAGSFQLKGNPAKMKWEFKGIIGALNVKKAKFDFRKAKFELKVRHFPDNDLIIGTTLKVTLKPGATHAIETVAIEDKCEAFRFKRKPKLDCLAEGIAFLRVTSGQGSFDFVPAVGMEALGPDTVVDDGVNGAVIIHTSGSQPLSVGDVFGAYQVADVVKIFSEYDVTVESGLRGITVEVSELDVYGDGTDYTDIGLVYPVGTIVDFSAPRYDGHWVFQRWIVDGVPQAQGLITTGVTVNGAHTLEAKYKESMKPTGYGTGDTTPVNVAETDGSLGR